MSDKKASLRTRQFDPRRHPVGGLLLAASSVLSSCNRRSTPATVECNINYWGQTHQAIVHPTTEPYRVSPLKIDDAFEFKAVYVTTPASEASLDFYAYYQTERGPIMVEQTQFLPPFPKNAPTLNGTFTGTHHVYGASGEELVYACRWRSP